MGVKKPVDSEATFRVAYEQALKRTGAWVEYLHSRERQGIPDLHFAARGCMGWQELKFVDQLPVTLEAGVLGHRVTALQRLFLSNACAAGGLGVVAVGHQGPKGLLVSFFWPWETSRDGQLTKAAFTSCRRVAQAGDGEAALQVLMEMADVSRQTWRVQAGKRQLALFPRLP